MGQVEFLKKQRCYVLFTNSLQLYTSLNLNYIHIYWTNLIKRLVFIKKIVTIVGKSVVVVNGAYREHKATLLELREKKFCCTIKLDSVCIIPYNNILK